MTVNLKISIPRPTHSLPSTLLFCFLLDDGVDFPAQTTFGNLINVAFDAPGNYCLVVEDLEIAGDSGSEISFALVDNDNCFMLMAFGDSCPTAGTGDGKCGCEFPARDSALLVFHKPCFSN